MALLLVFGARSFFYFPKDIDVASVRVLESVAQKTPLKSGQRLKIMVWNIQYAAGTNYNFFYEGGKDIIASKGVVDDAEDRIADFIKKQAPDILMVQEIDCKAKRSGYINQVRDLQNFMRYRFSVYTPQWKTAFFPIPLRQPVGYIDTGLAIFTSLPLTSNIRLSLGKNESMSFFANLFYMRRAILGTGVVMDSGKNLTLFTTHLEAYAKGDDTKHKQTQKLDQALQQQKNEGNLYFLGGDFNLLPPGFDPNQLNFEKEYYSAPDDNPVDFLFKKHKPALTSETYRSNPQMYNTYIPPKHKKADRWVDHIFMSPEIKVISYKVLQEAMGMSDHLPVLVEIELP